MNKKFSTLMAGLMLASAFSVADAQTVVSKYETNKTYWLALSSDGTSANEQVMAVVSNPKHEKYGQLITIDKDLLNDINAVKAATWSIVFTQPTDGTAPKFTYVNKATGLTLSLDPNAVGEVAMIKGGSSEWLNTSVIDNSKGAGKLPFDYLRSFYAANKAVYLQDGTDKTDGKNLFGTTEAENISYSELKVAVTDRSDAFTDGIKVAPAKPEVFPLNANDLNSQLGKIDLGIVKDSWFNLYFNQDVTDGAEKNLFAATPLKAVQMYMEKDATGNNTGKTTTASETKVTGQDDPVKNDLAPFVKLEAKGTDGSYIVVDTAYHTASENIAKLPKFTYAKRNYEGTNNVPRMAESFEFAFAYDPFEDKILIKSHGYYTKTTSVTPIYMQGEDGNEAYTYWGYASKTNAYGEVSDDLKVEEAYVRLVSLASVRELTVANDKMKDKDGNYDVLGIAGVNSTADWTTSGRYWADLGMLTKVTMSLADQTFSPTSIADGLYLIKLHTSGYDELGNKRSEADGDYLISSLSGTVGYAAQARNQNYDHMPAAQWLVQKQGTGNAPVKIINREFFDNKLNGYMGVDGDAIQLFNAGDGRVFFTANVRGLQNDTLEFIPVSDASKKDAYLGYKYVTPEKASVETYYFNYLSGLAQDKGLNTPSDKDSLVRVDETGDKIALRLIPVVKDDSYGQQIDPKKTGVANLIRNAYYIEAYDNLKFAADGQSRYLTYDSSTDKYIMSLSPMAFFLKENNDIDGTHYYALVEANLYGRTYNENGTYEWVDALNEAGKEIIKKMYPAKYAGMSTVHDATKVWSFYDLTQEKKIVELNGTTVELGNSLSPYDRTNVEVIFYDKDGEPIIADGSQAIDLWAYMPNGNNVIELTRVVSEKNGVKTYYAMNPSDDLHQKSIEGHYVTVDGKNVWAIPAMYSWSYASSRLSVDDNTLDLFKANVSNSSWVNELRVSAFEAQVNDSPLYRRFNGTNGEYGTEANAPLNLKFFRHNNNAEYLFENYASENEYRDGINDKEISFLGVNNAFQFPESETRSYTMFVDTAYVRANTRMPQYLIGIRPEVVLGDTTLCDATTHQHKTPEEALACEHTKINVGFTRAMYLFNAQDSVDVKNYDYQGKAAYGAQGYTRLAFKDAVHANDTLYILNPGVTTEELKACNLKNDKLFAKKIALDNNKHKNVVFQFRLVTDEDNRFLIESEAEENGKAVFNKDLKNVSVAPMRGGWVKIQNGVPVIARFDDFNEAIAQAEIFDVNDEIKYDATANDEIAVEGVTVVAGNGQVTIMGAAGKNVTITNILGKVIASQVIASDNATIAVPAGIVAVAVEGEAAVKAIVK